MTSGGSFLGTDKSTCGHQRAIGVANLHFGEQRAGGRVQRVRRAGDPALELPAGEFGHRQSGALPHAHRIRIGLRQVEIGPQ